jgi:hypothetical protein
MGRLPSIHRARRLRRSIADAGSTPPPAGRDHRQTRRYRLPCRSPPSGSRRGIGGLALGFYDPIGRLHFAGIVGTGFSDRELLDYAVIGEAMAYGPPTTLLAASDRPDRTIRWILPELVIEVSFTA